MLGIFGSLWESQYGLEDDPTGTWSSILRKLSYRQVEGGVQMMREHWEERGRLPSPGRFMKWAMDSVRPYDGGIDRHRRLQQLASSPEAAQEHLAKLKEIVR